MNHYDTARAVKAGGLFHQSGYPVLSRPAVPPLYTAGKATGPGTIGGAIHAVSSARHAGYVILFCSGRGMRDMVGVPGPITCKACTRKLAATGAEIGA